MAKAELYSLHRGTQRHFLTYKMGDLRRYFGKAIKVVSVRSHKVDIALANFPPNT